jgi:hypothetical protein
MLHRMRIVGCTLVALAMMWSPTDAVASTIALDFGAPGSATPSSASGIWNNITSGGMTASLLDIHGAATGVSVTVTADSFSGFYPSAFPTGSDEANLLDDYFAATAGNSWTVKISGLAAGSYTLHLFDAANPAVSSGDGNVFAQFNQDPLTNSFVWTNSKVGPHNINYLTAGAFATAGVDVVISGTSLSGSSGLAGLIIEQSGKKAVKKETVVTTYETLTDIVQVPETGSIIYAVSGMPALILFGRSRRRRHD